LVCLTNWQSDASKFPEFGHVSKEFTFAPGIGLPGRVWASAQATWIPDVVADRNFLRAPLAAQEGLHSGVGLPVTVRGEVIGVMGFFSHIVRPPEAELLQLLENVGQQVGLLTQRTEDEACAHEQMQLEAALEERLRLAHKLHDNVAQTVFPAAVLAELLPYLWDRDRNRVWYGLNELRQLTHTSLNQAHGLLSHLGGKTLAEADAGELLNRVVKKIASQTRLEVELSVKGECRLPTEAQIALYCIVQEALQNVLQHARATRATIHLHSYPEGTELRIGDNGRGFDLNRVLPDRLGLRIMRECASRFGATFEVTSQLNQGTQVILRWRTAR
jgi:signal transduction histidine kinase